MKRLALLFLLLAAAAVEAGLAPVQIAGRRSVPVYVATPSLGMRAVHPILSPAVDAAALGLFAGILPPPPGGNPETLLTGSTDDRVLIDNGSAWQRKALPDCDDTSGNHLNYDTGTNAFSCGTSSSGGGNTHTIDDAATNTVSDAVTLDHTTSGTPANGFGTGLLFSGESASVSAREMVRLSAVWTTATDATRDTELQAFTVINGTLAKRLALRTPTASSMLTLYDTLGNAGATLFNADSNNTGLFTAGPYLRLYGGSSGLVFGNTPGSEGTSPSVESGITSGKLWRLGDWTTPTGALEVNNGSAAIKIFRAFDNGSAVFEIGDGGDLIIARTITTAGTTGAQTINKISGTVNFAAAATSLVVTNSFVTANSIVHVVMRTNDSTCALKSVVPTAGSFTINTTAGCNAETSFGFLVTN